MVGKVTAALDAQKASAALWAARVAKATKAAADAAAVLKTATATADRAKSAGAIAKAAWDVAAKEQTAVTGANTAAVVAKRKSKWAAIDAHSVYVKFVKEGASSGMIH